MSDNAYAPPPKKARLNKFSAHNFVDDEADEDDEFEADEEELEVSDRELIAMQAEADARADRRKREFDRRMAQLKANKDAMFEGPSNPLADRLHDKYVNLARRNEEMRSSAGSPIRNEGAPVYADEMQDQEDEELLPSIQDPKLWMVYCIPGKERQCIIDLMNLWHRTAGKPDKKLFIKSAFTTDVTQSGYFYIEAFKEVHVRRATDHIQNVRRWKGAKIVPMDEMVHAMTTHDPDPPMKKGQWVRVKRGQYKDDLAQVLNIKDQGSKVKVKMLPRLDYANIHRPSEAFGRQRGSRPVQRLFNASEVREILANINEENLLENSRGMFYFKGNYYKNGYLIKEMNATAVMSNAQPTAEEVEKFKLRPPGMDSDEEAEDSIPAPPITQRKNKFETRDRVVVVEGALVNLLGLVQSMTGDTVIVIPDNEQLSDPLEFRASELRKYFEMGDHIKVVSGNNAGETGMVLRVEAGGSEIVFWSGEATTIVLAQDCTLSTEVNSGQDSIGDLELHDLVKLSRDSAGCIVQIKKGQIKLLNEKGMPMVVALKDVIQKLSTRNARASDVNRRDIINGDMVKVRQGEHAGHSGTIKHVYRSVVFLHSRQHSENNGIFWSKARYCELIGAGAHRADSKNRIITTARNTRFTRAQRRDPMTGLTVKIRLGGHKGHIGIVKRVAERGDQTILEVELHSPSVTISVPKNGVIRCDANGVPHRDNDSRGRNARSAPPTRGGMTPLIGAMTPAHSKNFGDDYGSRTPRHGSETPLLGSRTPLHRGAQTPLHRGNQTPLLGGQTPLHRGNRTPMLGGQTPVHPGSRTPGNIWTVGERTPHRETNFDDDDDDNVDMNPKTPSFQPATPNYPNSPLTPAMARDSPTPAMNPTTPRTPHSPINSPHTPMHHIPMTPHTPHSPGDALSPWGQSGNPSTPAMSSNPNSPYGPTTPTESSPTPMTPSPAPESPMSMYSPSPGGLDNPQSPRTPVPITPNDGHDDYDYPMTPATPMTPNPTPLTPVTPGPAPPSPYDKEEEYNDPKTPRTPVSPGTPNPYEGEMPNGGGHDSDSQSHEDDGKDNKPKIPITDEFDGKDAEINWSHPGVVVTVNGREGVIDSPSEFDKVMVVFKDNGVKEDVPLSDVSPVPPVKEDFVMILSAEYSGQIGELIGIENLEGIIQIKSTEQITVLTIDNLVKFDGEYYRSN